ncbi:MAG: HEPN domain-containing protein [Deltaproteobacteria bacterium]|nr:HEPN domain-containing protein [Deltaproteobacteria bacterium]
MPDGYVCFHAQQCVEKCLKACLAHEGIHFPKHHDIGELFTLLPPGIAIELSPDEQERLTDYATVTRYPGDYDEIPLGEAQDAVFAARCVRDAVARWLGDIINAASTPS